MHAHTYSHGQGEWSLATGPATPLNLVDGVGWLSSFAYAQMQSYCPQCVGSTAEAVGVGFFFWCHRLESGYQEWNFLEVC
jgi:hypothetical protein